MTHLASGALHRHNECRAFDLPQRTRRRGQLCHGHGNIQAYTSFVPTRLIASTPIASTYTNFRNSDGAHSMKPKQIWDDTRGSVLVEFTVTLPLFLLLTFGLLQAGLLLYHSSGAAAWRRGGRALRERQLFGKPIRTKPKLLHC